MSIVPEYLLKRSAARRQALKDLNQDGDYFSSPIATAPHSTDEIAQQKADAALELAKLRRKLLDNLPIAKPSKRSKIERLIDTLFERASPTDLPPATSVNHKIYKDGSIYISVTSGKETICIDGDRISIIYSNGLGRKSYEVSLNHVVDARRLGKLLEPDVVTEVRKKIESSSTPPREIPLGMDEATFRLLAEYGHGSVCSMRVDAMLEHLKICDSNYSESPLAVKWVVDNSFESPRANDFNGPLKKQIAFSLGFSNDQFIRDTNFIPFSGEIHIDDIGRNFLLGFVNETVGFYFEAIFVPLIYLIDRRDVSIGCSIGQLNETVFRDVIGEQITVLEDENKIVIGERDPNNENKLLAAAHVIDLFIDASNEEDAQVSRDAITRIVDLFDIEMRVYEMLGLSPAISYRKEIATRELVSKIFNDRHFGEGKTRRFEHIERIDASEGIQYDTDDMVEIVPSANGGFVISRHLHIVAGKSGNRFHAYQAEFGPKLGDVTELRSNTPGVALREFENQTGQSFESDQAVDYALEKIGSQLSGLQVRSLLRRVMEF